MDELNSRYWSSALRRPVSRRTILRGAGLTGAGLAAAALVGCGGEDAPATADGGATGTGDAGTGTGTAASAGAPKTGGRLALTQAGDPPSFDLHRESTTYTAYATSMAYNQLLRMDPAVGEETPESVVGDLASDWEISPDGLTYTFHLVQNAKYHNGAPFTSADAKATYERQINPPADLIPPRGGQIAAIGSIDTPDDYTLVLNLTRPVSSLSLLPILAQGWMAVYSKADIEGGFDFRKQANGTGPFIQQAYEQGVKVVYDRNPEYWVADQPYVDGVDVYIIPDQSTTLANFQAGALHIYGPTKRDLESLDASLGDKIVTQPTNSYGFNTVNFGGREPWTDVRVRQAVTLAHNKQSAIDVLSFGDGRLGGYLSGGGYWSLSPEELESVPGYAAWEDARIAEARKLLDAAGVAASLNATILTRQGSTFESFSLYVQDQLAKIGINASLDIQETASAYDVMAKRDFDLAPWAHAYAVDDPDAVFAEFYITDAPRNYSQISTPEIDELYLAQSQEQDPEARREMVRELQKLAMPEYGKVLVNWTNARETHWATVKNYTSHTSIYNNRRWADLWLDA